MKCLHNVKITLAFCGIVPLLLGNCVSMVEKLGQSLDGSVPAEKRIAVYRAADIELREVENKAGERSIVITLQQFPAMKLRGSYPDDRGEFHLVSLDYLGGNPQGWNEYSLELFGSGSLIPGETSARLSVHGEIEMVHIVSGRIRRYDTRITGNEALTSLRNRRERILVLTEWFNGREDYASMTASPQVTDLKAFDAYWKPILFPEIAAKRKRPENWQREGDRMVKAEDIRWNIDYTEREFPEELRTIRNSGTMLRDWEEALEWIYIECEWDRITELLSQETVLQRAKR